MSINISSTSDNNKNRIFIVAAILCLLTAVSLFIYSEYQLNTQSTPAASLPLEKNSSKIESKLSEQNIVQKEETVKSEVNIEVNKIEQPDKSLPVPAHQLKKILADQPDTQTLDDRIAKANQTIEKLDQQLVKNQQKTTNSNKVSDATVDKKSQALDKRIEHIRNHLQQKNN